MVLYPITFYLPIFFQAVQLDSTIDTAVAVLPACCFLIGSSVISGLVVEKYRRYVWLLRTAWALLSIETGLLALLDASSPTAASVGCQAVVGVELGILFRGPPSLALQASVSDPDDQGFSIGLLCSFRLFRGLVGLAVGSSAFSKVFRSSIASLEPLLGEDLSILRSAGEAVSFIPRLRELGLAPELMNAIKWGV